MTVAVYLAMFGRNMFFSNILGCINQQAKKQILLQELFEKFL